MIARPSRSFRRLMGGAVSVIAACTLGSCGKTTGLSRGGLMLIVSKEGSLPIARLDVTVSSKGMVLLSRSYKVPEEAQLPATIALVSNGDATAQASVTITGWEVTPGHADVPLDRRDAIVTQIPSDRVAELRVVLSAACSKWVDGSGLPTCVPSGYTCDQTTGTCVPPDVAATTLPTFQAGDADAGVTDTAGGASNGGSGATAGSRGEGTLGGASPSGGNGNVSAGQPSSAGGVAAGGLSGSTGGAAAGGMSGATAIAGGTGGSLCGNGMLDATEKCDDGNTTAGDGCSATCQVEQGWTCGQGAPAMCTPVCGDGLVVGAEAKAGGCDDRNATSSDGCSASCKVEAGYACSGTPSVCAKTCGDGTVAAGEACDDGNTTAGDGCFACAVESGYTCDTNQPSRCTDINECTNGTNKCSANATCANTPGSFTCTCVGGYSGNGVTCVTVCDILATAGNPCVAAHSTTRALYAGYSGPLYQVCKGSYVAGPTSCTSGLTKDIGVVAGGYADAASQDAFCAGATCTISIVYDQSANANHLTPGPPGGAKNSADNPANATDLKTTINGHEAYGILIKPGIGYRKLLGNGTATGDAAETEYIISSQNDLKNACCFEYGNAETSARDDGNGAAEAVYFGGGVVWGTGVGGIPGPWVEADLENGLYAGWENGQDKNISTNIPLKYDFVTALLIGDTAAQNAGSGRFALYGGDATTGTLTTMYDGIRPTKTGYATMKKEGSIILGIGGDNSNAGGGRWFEGIMASGAATLTTINALQANIVSARYGK